MLFESECFLTFQCSWMGSFKGDALSRVGPVLEAIR